MYIIINNNDKYIYIAQNGKSSDVHVHVCILPEMNVDNYGNLS